MKYLTPVVLFVVFGLGSTGNAATFGTDYESREYNSLIRYDFQYFSADLSAGIVIDRTPPQPPLCCKYEAVKFTDTGGYTPALRFGFVVDEIAHPTAIRNTELSFEKAQDGVHWGYLETIYSVGGTHNTPTVNGSVSFDNNANITDWTILVHDYSGTGHEVGFYSDPISFNANQGGWWGGADLSEIAGIPLYDEFNLFLDEVLFTARPGFFTRTVTRECWFGDESNGIIMTGDNCPEISPVPVSATMSFSLTALVGLLAVGYRRRKT